MKNTFLTFSIILPIYHQKLQIGKIIKDYSLELNKLKESYELLLIINGGDKESFDEAEKIAVRFSNVRVIYLKDMGWGNAVLKGIKNAEGKYICYTNSARTRVTDLSAILKLARKNPGIVIKATRILRAGFLRKLGSTLYNIECRLLLKVSVWDINGTPKVLPRNVINNLHLVSKDDLIDAELIAKCMHAGIQILEFPVLFPPRLTGKSTTNYLSAIKMYIGVFGIKKKLQKKSYWIKKRI